MYCPDCRAGYERSPDGLQHTYLDGTFRSWCKRASDRDIARELGGRRTTLHSKPLDFSIMPKREKIMAAHRKSKYKMRQLERRLNAPPKREIAYKIGNFTVWKED